MDVYGIDFTSRPGNKKPITCRHCRLDGGVLHALSPSAWSGFAAFEAALALPGPWITGIDFPFGMPRRFVADVGWPAAWRDYVRHAEGLGKKGFEAVLDTYRKNQPDGEKEHRRRTDVLSGSLVDADGYFAKLRDRVQTRRQDPRSVEFLVSARNGSSRRHAHSASMVTDYGAFVRERTVAVAGLGNSGFRRDRFGAHRMSGSPFDRSVLESESAPAAGRGLHVTVASRTASSSARQGVALTVARMRRKVQGVAIGDLVSRSLAGAGDAVSRV